MRLRADAVVIGAGILGTSIGLELNRLGMKALVIDKNADAGQGSTQLSSAIIRCFYGTRPAVALAYEGRRVYENWAEHLAPIRPGARFERVGCALLLAAQDRAGDAVSRLLGAAGVGVESLSGREAQTLVPGMRAAKTRVLFEPGAGYVTRPSQATRDVRAAAEAVGTRFLFGERVVDIRSLPGGRNGGRRIIGLNTSSGARVDAPVVINAAGPHSAEVNLLARSPLALTTAALAQRVVRGKLDGAFGAAESPVPIVADVPSGHYLRVDASGFRVGNLSPRDDHDWVANADTKPKIPRAYLPERRRAFLRRHPGVRWKDAVVRTALYDVTLLDWYPIVDRTEVDGYYVAIGTSGAWFKGAPVLGWMAAKLVEAVENGLDHDQKPLAFTLPRTRLPFDLGFLSRRRAPIRSELGRGVLG